MIKVKLQVFCNDLKMCVCVLCRVYTKLLEVLQEGNFLEPSTRAERSILEAFARAERLLQSIRIFETGGILDVQWQQSMPF